MTMTTTAPTTASTEAPVASPTGSTARTRDPWFDNAKFVLVALVVVGHALMLLQGSAVDWLYDFLYAWHVPAFVLVTGYLSRSFDYTPARVRALVRTVVVPYVMFEGLLAVFRTTVGGEEIQHLWRDPHWPMWYLSALFFWRLATPVFKRLPAPVAFLGAVALSVAGGWWAGQTFDLARVFGLLPFFVLGLHLRREHFVALRRAGIQRSAVVVLGAILLAARFTDRWISTEWLYYRTEYHDLGVTGDHRADLIRLAVIGVGLLGALAVLSLIPSGRTWYTPLGSASLVVYLVHGFFIKSAEYAGVPAWAAEHQVVALVLVPALAVVLAAALAAPPVARRLNHLVDPVGAVAALRSRVSRSPSNGPGSSQVPTSA